MNSRYWSLHIFVAIAIVALVAFCDAFRPYDLQLSHFYIVAVLYLAWFVPGLTVWYFTVFVACLAIAIPFFDGRDYSNRLDGTLVGAALAFAIWNRQRYAHDLNASNIAMSGQIQEQVAALQSLNSDLTEQVEERHQAEASLRDSEALFRGLVEALPDLIFRVDPRGTITYAKSEPADDLLLPADALVGRRYRDYMPQSVADRFDEAIAIAVKSSSVQTLDYELNLPDGRHQHFEGRVVGFVDGSSVLVVRNDTERRHAIEALQESESRFRQLAENIQEVFWIASADGSRIDYISPAYEVLVGRPCASVYADPTAWLEVVYPDDKASVVEEFFREARNGYDREYRILRPDGEVRWVRDRTFPVRNECGEVERVVGLGEDITERKQAEHELATAHHRTTLLARLTKELNNCTTPRSASLLILETAKQAINWDCSWIQLWNEQLQAFEGLVEFDLFDDDCREVPQDPNERRSVSPIMQRVMQEGPQLVLRTSETDQTEGFRFVGNQRRSLSMMYVPIRHGERFVGALSIQSYRKQAYDQAALELLQLLASHCAGALARIQTAEALQEGERRYHRLLEELPIGVFVHDGQQFHYANPSALRILGLTEMSALAVRSPIEWIAPELRDIARQRIDAVLKAGEVPPPMESISLRRDGSRVDVEICSRPAKFANRNCVQVLFQDITSRKKAESLLNGQKHVLERAALGAPLIESLNELTRIVENHSPGMLCSILLLDLDGVHLHHGAAPNLPPDYVAAIDGVAIGPAVGSCGTAAFYREPVMVEDIATDPRWRDYKAVALSAGLRACWSTPIFDTRSQVLGTFAMYYRHPALPTLEDKNLITMASQLAAVVIGRHRMETNLRESENRLRTLLENLENVAVQAYEVDGTVTFWNRASERLYGFTALEAIGKDVVSLLLTDDEAKRERRLIADALRTGCVPAAEELEVVRKDGTVASIISSRVLHSRPGRPPEFFCFDVDITDRKQAEEELAIRQVELLHAARLSTVGQMVATLSHEVAQPLTAIGNFTAASAQLLATEPLPRIDKLNEYVQAISKQNDRCSAILDRLRQFSKRSPVQRSSHALKSIVQESIDLVQGDFRRDSVEISCEYPDDLPLILVDKIQIQQVLVNLLTNARDAVRQQPINFRQVKVSTRANESAVEIEVADRGQGISEDIREKIFEPFYTTKDTGMGIGLSISRRIVREHGGNITACSNDQGGATFRISLPLNASANSQTTGSV